VTDSIIHRYTQPPDVYDAIVGGGGIVGMATCYHLARSGLDAGVIDRADEGRATDAGAGVVSPATSSRTDSEPWFRFALPAADYHPEMAATLRAEQKGPVGYARPGLVQVAFEPETARSTPPWSGSGTDRTGTVAPNRGA